MMTARHAAKPVRRSPRAAVWLASAAMGVLATGCSFSTNVLNRDARPSAETATAATTTVTTAFGETVALRDTAPLEAAARQTQDDAPGMEQTADATPGAVASSAETLGGAIALAFQSNPTLQAERAALRAAGEGVTIARGDRFPQISASAGLDYTDLDRTDNAGALNENLNVVTFSDRVSETTRRSVALSASQTLYAGGSVRAGIDAAAATREAARAQLATVEQGVLLDVITSYVNTRRDQEVVRIRANNVDVLLRQFEAARDRFEVGEVTRTDVAQAEARLAGARTELAAARASLASTRALYEQVVGQAPGTLAPPPPLPPLPETFNAAAETASDNNPAIIAARFAEAGARANVRAARSAFRPSINATASAQLAGDRGDFSQGRAGDPFASAGDVDEDTETLAAGLTATIPLFTGGANGARVRQALASGNQARLQVREAERSVQAAVTSTWNTVLATRAQIDSSREQVRANEVAFEGVEEEARVGGRTTLDVLDAEQELLDARLALVTAESDAYVAGFALLEAIGELAPRALSLAAAGPAP